jgi:uncharacterized protein YfbU (UPF0304 family)
MGYPWTTKMKYIEWLDKKIAQTKKKLAKLEHEKDEEYYSMYDIVKNMLDVYRTCKKQYEALP